MPVSLTSSEFYIRNDSITLIQGADCVNVLDRMVSTKISEIQDLSRTDALFCDFNGRISDVALIHSISGKILITSSNSQSEETRRKLVDGVSWDEDCEIFVADEAIFRITIFPTDFAEISKLFGVEMSGLPHDSLVQKDDHLFVKCHSQTLEFFDMLVKHDNMDNVLSLLRDSDFVEMEPDRWDHFRIMLGIREICDSIGNLPDEMGWGSLVSNDKGCYPGQEIHARLESRGRVTKALCRLTGNSPVELGKHKVPGFGTISISSATYLDGESLCMALIRLENDHPNTIEIQGNEFTIEVMGYP